MKICKREIKYSIILLCSLMLLHGLTIVWTMAVCLWPWLMYVNLSSLAPTLLGSASASCPIRAMVIMSSQCWYSLLASSTVDFLIPLNYVKSPFIKFCFCISFKCAIDLCQYHDNIKVFTCSFNSYILSFYRQEIIFMQCRYKL